MPKPQRANKATTVDTLAEHWDQPAACISQCGCLYVCIRIQVCTYTYVRSRASIAAVQSLIMLMDIRFDLAELTRHMLLPLLFFSFFSCQAKPH